MANEKSQRHIGKRPGRKPSKVDQRVERSRQSARECRARKKLRYQYLEKLVSTREKAVFSLREELDTLYKEDVDDWCCFSTLKSHGSTVWSVAFDKTGTRLASCSDDLTVKI